MGKNTNTYGLKDINYPQPGTIVSGDDKQGYVVIGDDEQFRQVFKGVLKDYKDAFDVLGKL